MTVELKPSIARKNDGTPKSPRSWSDVYRGLPVAVSFPRRDAALDASKRNLTEYKYGTSQRET